MAASARQTQNQFLPDSRKTRVMVGLSGGVDSSVTAWLASRAWQAQALFMKNWEEDDRDGVCTAAEDLGDARAVAEQLGLTLHTRNFASEYWDQVFTHCLQEFRRGRTPNPDILCNREIKFRVFLDAARELGADYIATGHYARRLEGPDGWQLARAVDLNKDQTYFLYALDQQQLQSALFPVGHLSKPEVRALAREAGLQTHGKKDSTGICFIGERNFRQFLQQYLPAQPGDIRSVDGEKLGEHQGLMFHTLGQRKGLGIGGMHGAEDQPWYVAAKDLESNTLIVCQHHDHPLLMSRRLVASQINWIAGHAPQSEHNLSCKTRYRQPDQACRIHEIQDDRIVIDFPQAQRAVTPGQSVVLYQDDICLGGGIIESTST